ncbi:monooxygenase 2-like [Lycium ferocissimum]|uniref:monooxygenase 2-like n=1 Tax=Lycium ferocissimum TaxID=112874 RepID=UPI002815D218|nr:monooxygenase 2-like [Lycium ferocissimum]
MALIFSILQHTKSFSSSNISTYVQRRMSLIPRVGARYMSSVSTVNAKANDRKENIVIVGAGIAGLASAVSLQRFGIRSLVLEQAESLRTEGSSITLSKNGWKALDAIGVGDELRSKFLELQGIVIKADEGKVLNSFGFKDEDKSQELRVVERRVLLETLASKLPPDAISYSSELSKIETGENGNTLLQLQDGTRLSAEVVIACDGVWSPTAKWMGFRQPKYAGHITFRGLGYFPEGQPYEPKVNYTYARGLRAGYVPASKTKVYWFVVCNSSSPGPRITDPSILRQQAKELVRDWPVADMLNLINLTPNDTLTRNPLYDRWLWPLISPPPSSGKTVLVGDAWHPMTPNMGQGACCALEDSIVLTEKLAEAMNSKNISVEEAFKAYGSERWRRVFPLTVMANRVGALLQSENKLICSVRNNIIVPKLLKPRTMTRHANYEFEQAKRNKH